MSVLAISDLDGIGTLQKMLVPFIAETHTHLAQEVDKPKKEPDDAVAVVSPTTAS